MPHELLSPMRVSFTGEAGVDAGGLTRELFSGVLTQVFESHSGRWFEHESKGVLLPAAGAPPAELEAIGKLVCKCILEEVPVPGAERWSFVLYKFLCSGSEAQVHVSLDDFLEFVAVDEYRATVSLQAMSEEQLRATSVTFEGLKLDGEREAVGRHNVSAFITLKARERLLGSRLPAFRAFRAGLLCVDALRSILGTLSPRELKLLIGGDDELRADAVVGALRMRDFPPSSHTPLFLKEILHEWSGGLLTAFVRFVTAASRLRPQDQIVVRRASVGAIAGSLPLPVAHTCFSQLDLPDYNDKAVLVQKLTQAVREAGSAFALA
jgi:E3 ubiquitin-protein ligase HUWE1